MEENAGYEKRERREREGREEREEREERERQKKRGGGDEDLKGGKKDVLYHFLPNEENVCTLKKKKKRVDFFWS